MLRKVDGIVRFFLDDKDKKLFFKQVNVIFLCITKLTFLFLSFAESSVVLKNCRSKLLFGSDSTF